MIDLLDLGDGGEEKPKKKRKVKGAGPGKARHENYKGAKLEINSPQDWDQFTRPVSVTKLMLLFRKDRQTVKRRLADLPPIGTARGQDPLYDFLQAAQYLVTPRMNPREFIKKMNPSDLPPELSQAFWAAQRSRQIFMREAGELWHTEDVQEVFGAVFQAIKRSTQLWVGQVESAHEIDPDAREELVRQVDGLLDMIHDELKKVPEGMETPSQAADYADTDLLGGMEDG